MLSMELKTLAQKYGQSHLIEMAQHLTEEKRLSFEKEVAALNFAELQELFEQSQVGA